MSYLFRYEDALRPNLLLLLYISCGYFLGGYLMLMVPAMAWLGCLLFAHVMVIAAYLVHECAHNSVFRKNKFHRWLAEPLLWICGCSYSHFDDIRHKHVRHHTDKADIVSFDFRVRLQQYPLLLRIIYALEYMYIPALEIMMHLLVIILPFIKSSRKQRRGRVITVLLLRSALFIALTSISLQFLIWYALAYGIFLHVMRFMDVHQHTYELYETLDLPRGDEAKKHDRQFEHNNTYSNLISTRYAWLNLLVLNFSYHNAHHQQPGTPWYQLPGLHKKLYSVENEVGDQKNIEKNPGQVLEFTDLLKSYHRFRIARILNADKINTPVTESADSFIGVDGVSFLTAH